MSKEITLIVILFILANILAWFQSNSQFIWSWWYERPMFTVLIYSVPTSLAFYYGWRYAVEAFDGSLWGARMFVFGIATIVFAILSYVFKGEGINLKTTVCLILSFAIILIQVLWKTPPSS